MERLADFLTKQFGTVAFLGLNVVWFVVWISWNSGVLGLEPFDPYPFGFLTMAVSLEAIGLAIVVVISQNRAAKVADVREEIALQINKVSEEEITKIMELLVVLLEKQGVDLQSDSDLQKMLRPLEATEIEVEVERELS